MYLPNNTKPLPLRTRVNNMDNSWDNFEPAPLEFFHARLFHHFHEYRKKYSSANWVTIGGIEFGDIIARAKLETYAKYPKQVNNKAISKSEL